MKVLPIALLCTLLFGPVGVIGAVWAVINVARGEYLTAVVSLGFAMFCLGLIIPFAKAVPGNLSPSGEFDDEGTTIRPDRGVDIPVQISLLGLTVSSGLFAVFGPAGILDIPVPEQMRLYLPFVSGAIAIMGAPIMWRTFRRGSLQYLRLTPKGFSFVQGWRPQSGDWAQIVDVTDASPNQSAPTPNSVIVVMCDEDVLTIPGASFTPEGRALRELVRFYWQNPNCRDELTDGRALKRLAESSRRH
ncbi:hypothetical protein A5790_02700 [Mycobacterium sp. 852002-51152_SCH6134967]|uniref:hypothetical protein n=1 Tax=Mycobacterium sp. 852002-51152_SCH6134967 TaxID=1834096 RepID=UPI0007FBACA7|nr:hypothetical protein [Mycobacterium sp. 852002-51152_SCH6134967]OBF98660.1 hypothetical protein A5790_02700 [Mycobacterium sp. 852002-51152_SCH6134967]